MRAKGEVLFIDCGVETTQATIMKFDKEEKDKDEILHTVFPIGQFVVMQALEEIVDCALKDSKANRSVPSPSLPGLLPAHVETPKTRPSHPVFPFNTPPRASYNDRHMGWGQTKTQGEEVLHAK